MKKKNRTIRYISTFVLCLALAFLMGCGKKNNVAGNLQNSLTKATDSAATNQNEQDAQAEETKPEETASEDAQPEETPADQETAEDETDADSDEEADVNCSDEEAAALNAKDPEYVKIENPSWDYYPGGNAEPKTGVTLKEESKEPNDITDVENWNSKVGFEPPYDPYSLLDDLYIYNLYGQEYNGTNWSQYMLDICDLCMGDPMYILDFSEFYVPDQIKAGDEPYVCENIHWVKCKDDVLYVSIYHNTYAESAPHNAYIVALDMNDNYKILWKTEPLTCNSNNFIVTDDAIICGYGFTAEDDFVYVLDRETGARAQTYKVKSSPDWFHLNGNKLYVRCYNADYVFDVAGL